MSDQILHLKTQFRLLLQLGADAISENGDYEPSLNPEPILDFLGGWGLVLGFFWVRDIVHLKCTAPEKSKTSAASDLFTSITLELYSDLIQDQFITLVCII